MTEPTSSLAETVSCPQDIFQNLEVLDFLLRWSGEPNREIGELPLESSEIRLEVLEHLRHRLFLQRRVLFSEEPHERLEVVLERIRHGLERFFQRRQVGIHLGLTEV